MTTVHPPRSFIARPDHRHGAAPPGPRPLSGAGIDPFRVVRKHMTAIIASGVFGVLLGIIAWFVLSITYPLYSASVMFEIIPALEDPEQATPGELTQDEAVVRFARTEMVYLLERDVLRTALQKPAIWQQTEWANKFKTQDGRPDVDEAVDELQEDLVVRYLSETNLFEVRWAAHEKNDVPIVINSIRDAYMQKRRQLIDADFRDDLDVFIRDEKSTQQDLLKIEEEIDGYIRTHGILTLAEVRDHPLAFEVNALNQMIATTLAQISMLETQQQQIAAKLGGVIEPTAEDRAVAEMDPIARQLALVIAGLETQRAELLMLGGTESLALKQVEIKLQATEDSYEAKLDEIMSRNLNSQLKEVSNALEIYAQMIDQKRTELSEKDKRLGEMAGKVATYQSMERRRESLHLQLEAAQMAVQDMKLLRQRASASRVRAYPPAETPREKSFPQPYIIIPLGFLLVLGVTVSIVFLRELTDKRVKSASDLSLIPGARVLGVIPDVDEDPTRIEGAEMAVRQSPRSVIAESYRQTCTPIVKALEERGHQSLVVIGGLPGSGATTVVSNIAAFIAVGGKRVLTIDANFRRPALGKALGIDDATIRGLGDVLTQSADAADVIVPVAEGMDVMTAGTPASRVFERLNNGVFDTMIAELRTRYDYIVVDAPPAVVAGDALVLANKTDASVLVVRANEEQRGLVARLISQFDAAQSELIGVILNRPRFTAGGYFKKNYATMAEYAVPSTSGSL